MTDRTGQGVRVVCGRPPEMSRTVSCIRCGQPFVVPPVAFSVMSGIEVLGVFGPCCLNPCCRALLAEKCRESAQARTSAY
jgi:hypothetical protein